MKLRASHGVVSGIGLVATLLIICTGTTFAQSKVGISVAVAYHKGGDKYSIVVKNKPGTKMELYVNDKNPVTATADKHDWATFNGVKLTGSAGKVSFTKVVNGKQKAINYTRGYAIKKGHVSFGAYVNPNTPAYKLAVADLGHAPSAAVDAQYQAAMSALKPYCTENKVQIAAMIKEGLKLLKQNDITDETNLTLLQHTKESIPTDSKPMNCANVIGAYVTLREGD